MTRRRTLLTAGGTALAAGLTGGQYLLRPHRPRPRTFGISVAGADISSIDAVTKVGATLDHTVQVTNFFMAWQWRSVFPAETVDAIRAAGAIPEITWEPWDPRAGVMQSAYALANLAAYDDYTGNWAHALANYGHKLYLRFAHEMNSDWYPWAVSANGGSPGAYIEAYRRLHRQFADAGAHNVRWVWCPNIVYQNRPDLIEAAYPGDDVVDVVAVDGYSNGWQSPQDLLGPTLDLLTRLAPRKPLWINEIGCGAGARKAQWITDLFAYLETTRVGTVLWFELDRPGGPDWKLLSTPETTAAARSSLARW